MHPSTSVSLILASLASSTVAIEMKIGSLKALEGVVRGADSTSLQSNMRVILDSLAEAEIIQNENMLVLEQAAKVVQEVAKKALANASLDLFYLLANLISVEGNEKIPGYTNMKNIVRVFDCRQQQVWKRPQRFLEFRSSSCIACIFKKCWKCFRLVARHGTSFQQSLACLRRVYLMAK